MPSASPSPSKRPSLNERTSSTHSLSSSSRQTSTHKVYRPHTVTRHSRNVSQGKGLSKLGRVQSTASITSDNQKKKKTGGTTPPHSPRAPLVKRNSSHVALAKNTSFGNLRKNHSATALPRNLSQNALKKIGLPPAAKPKEAKDGVFQLGDRSSGDEEEEGEWEDSATQSPGLTRNNSKTSTPARSHTPNGEQASQLHPAQEIARAQKTSSPPHASLRNKNRSAPNLKNEQPGPSQTQNLPDPALLQQYPRSSRAPPAMSTVSAHAGPSQLPRSDSSRSFTHISHADATSSYATPASAGNPGSTSSGHASRPLPSSASVEAGVSHFLHSDTPTSSIRQTAQDSDEDSPTSFLSKYKPQPSESPEKTKTLHKTRMSQMQSRTQQKLDLQKREITRVGAVTPTAPLAPGMGVPMTSATSLHGRAASRNRNRSAAGEMKAVKQDYETAVKQFLVVRRFRSPLIDSLSRLKDKNVIPQEIGTAASGSGSVAAKSRPQSRRGPGSTIANGNAKGGGSRSFEEQRSPPATSRSNSRGRGSGRVHFQRQSSHDDIGVTPLQPEVGLDGAQDDEQDGLSAEEAMIRRIWDSHDVYESGEHAQA